MPTIQVDFDVFKALTMRRASEEVTENDVLRQLLGLSTRKGTPTQPSAPAPGDWITKGVRFPAVRGSGVDYRQPGQWVAVLASTIAGAGRLENHRVAAEIRRMK